MTDAPAQPATVSPVAGAPATTHPPAPTGTRQAAAHLRRRRHLVGLVAVSAVAGFGYLAGHDPHDPSVAMPLCPIRHVTGLDCPACGTLRAVHSLLHGQWSTAVTDNAFVLAAAPLLLILLARQGRAVWSGREAPLPAPLAYGLGATALAWMVVRNLAL